MSLLSPVPLLSHVALQCLSLTPIQQHTQRAEAAMEAAGEAGGEEIREVGGKTLSNRVTQLDQLLPIFTLTSTPQSHIHPC